MLGSICAYVLSPFVLVYVGITLVARLHLLLTLQTNTKNCILMCRVVLSRRRAFVMS